ncbi:M56 family metallopeptidase [Streptomyces sp. NPDC052051]|uniref:M56 family metallopeptidase n=1 Tax=Streptomyces sp. NPDC052051 TaxID=3154649 RepID=UPI0034472249
MNMSWLGYPQVILAAWCPAATVGLWHLLRRLTERLPARERFVLAVGTALTPLLAMTVPYLPHSPLREALPWRAPIAWGISNGITDADPERVLSAVGAQLMLAASIVPLLSLAVSFVAGAVHVVRTARTVAQLAPRQCGDIWIADGLAGGAGGGLGDEAGQAVRNLASTVGLARPRIILSSSVAQSAEASAIIQHEQAHARARHPMWIFLATCALRSWWWIPGRKAILGEIRLAAELWADQDARAADGAVAVARALCAQIDTHTRLTGPDFAPVGGSVGFLDPGVELVHRAQALAVPPRVLPAWQSWTVRALIIAAVGAAAVLL